MALANILSEAGHVPDSVAAEAVVTFGPTDEGPTIQKIELSAEVAADGLDEDELARHADAAGPVARSRGRSRRSRSRPKPASPAEGPRLESRLARL
jgi:hypothetical protein